MSIKFIDITFNIHCNYLFLGMIAALLITLRDDRIIIIAMSIITQGKIKFSECLLPCQ